MDLLPTLEDRFSPDMDLMLQQGLKKPFVVISPSLLNKFLNILKLVLVQMSFFTGWLVTWFLQHPNVFKVQILKIFVEKSCMQKIKCIHYKNVKLTQKQRN